MILLLGRSAQPGAAVEGAGAAEGALIRHLAWNDRRRLIRYPDDLPSSYKVDMHQQAPAVECAALQREEIAGGVLFHVAVQAAVAVQQQEQAGVELRAVVRAAVNSTREAVFTHDARVDSRDVPGHGARGGHVALVFEAERRRRQRVALTAVVDAVDHA